MLISIITCTWNSVTTLRQTLDSVQQQSYADVEHVFVDGGSTDGTLELIDAYPGRKILLRGLTGGISKAMNAGLRAANGEVICHLHSDDYFLHCHVLKRVAHKFSDSSVGWLFGRILNDIDGGLYPENFKVPEYKYSRLIRGNFIPHPALFVRSTLFTEVGDFREDLRFAMDYDLLLRLAKRCDPTALNEAFSVFRRHDGSTTQSNQLAAFEEDYKVRRSHIGALSFSQIHHYFRYLVRRQRLLAAGK